MTKITFMPVSEVVSGIAPTPTAKVFPGWYKEQPKFISGEHGKLINGTYDTTVKKCPAISDTLAMGYTLYTPVDIYISAKGERVSWQVPITANLLAEASKKESILGEVPIVAFHTKDQVSKFPFDREVFMDDIFRIHPQWVVITEPGYSCLFINPMNQDDDSPLQAIPGVIDTDTYASNGPFSFLVKRGFEGVIKQGTPILQVVPFKREDYKMEVLSKPDNSLLMKQAVAIRSVFANGYRIKNWVKKIYQ